MSTDRRNRDQKRKAKLAKRKQKERRNEPLAYMGKKYKTEELIPLWVQTEIGIYECFIISDQTMVDQTVVNALEKLLRHMRSRTLPPLPDSFVIEYSAGVEEDLMIENIRRRWAEYFEQQRRHSRDDIIGVLRSILGSIQKVRSASPRSQSYLHHIAGFLTKELGVSVQQVSSDGTPLPGPQEDELVLLGRDWADEANPRARAEFYELADELIRVGDCERVIDACHQLLGENCAGPAAVVEQLIDLSNQARKSLAAMMG